MLQAHCSYTIICNRCGGKLPRVGQSVSLIRKEAARNNWTTESHPGKTEGSIITEDYCDGCSVIRKRESQTPAESAQQCVCGIHIVCPLHPAGGGKTIAS